MGSQARQPDCIEADMGLVVDDHTRQYMYFGVSRTEAQRRASQHSTDHGGEGTTVKQKVLNGRGVPALTLDDASFELVRAPTALATEDFYRMADDVDVVKRYYSEVQEFVKSKLGCDEVVCIHHQVRNAKRSGEPGVAGYAGGSPHTDSSGISGDALALGIADGLGKGRFQRYLYVNLWRNIADEPIENDHLAVLDERSVAKPDDYVVRDLFVPTHHIVQYGLNARHAAHHRWYYFPRMERDEALLFKQTDSDFTKTGRTCFHMSVADPAARGDAKSRESIEVRMLCFWKQAKVDAMPTQENMFADKQKNPRALAERGPVLQDATVMQLLGSLVARACCGGAKKAEKPRYSGKPEDYVERLTQAIKGFPHWPEDGKKWVRTTMAQRGTDAGLQVIVTTVVRDPTGFLGTRDFTSAEQKAIANHLLSDADFMATAKDIFARKAPEKATGAA